MSYKIDYLPSAVADILDVEAYLYAFSPAAADKFMNEIERLTQTLAEFPMMFQVFEDDDYFRSMPLCYHYRLFYHVFEEAMTITVHRVLHGMRDLKSEL